MYKVDSRFRFCLIGARSYTCSLVPQATRPEPEASVKQRNFDLLYVYTNCVGFILNNRFDSYWRCLVVQGLSVFLAAPIGIESIVKYMYKPNTVIASYDENITYLGNSDLPLSRHRVRRSSLSQSCVGPPKPMVVSSSSSLLIRPPHECPALLHPHPSLCSRARNKKGEQRPEEVSSSEATSPGTRDG